MIRNPPIFIVLLLVVIGCQKDTSPVTIGAVLPLTGEYSLYGESIHRGIVLALEDLSARKEYSRTWELSIVDSTGDPDQATELLTEQYSNDVLAVIGGVTTAEALAMVPVADRFGKVLISPSASSPELTGISKNFFRIYPSDSKEGTTMGAFARADLGLKSIVILAEENPYATSAQLVFNTEFKRHGGEIQDLIEFQGRSSDLTGLIERVITLEPEAVYLAAYAQEVGSMITSLRQAGYKKTILTTSAFAAPEAIEQVGDAAEGIFLTQAVFDLDSEDVLTQNFVDRYRDRNGSDPNLFAAHGYDAMLVIGEAFLRCGQNPKDIRKGLRALHELPGLTGSIHFDDRGDVPKFPRVYVIKEGALVNFKDARQAELDRKRKEIEEIRERIRKARARG